MTSTSRWAGLLAAAFSCSALAAFAQETPPAPRPNIAPPIPMPAPMAKPAPMVKLPPNVAARVGGRDITREEVLALFDLQHGRPFVGQVVQMVAIEQEAKRLGVSVTPAELADGVKKAKEEIATRMMSAGTPMTFAEFAEQNGIDENIVRYSIGVDLLRRKTLEKSLESQLLPLDKQYKLAHILVATIPLDTTAQAVQNPPTPEEQAKKDAEAKTKIDGILADITAKRISFEDAAKANSDDPSNKDKGGVLGWSSPGLFVPAFDEAAFAMKTKGQIVGPIKTNFGYHLIQLLEKGVDATPAEKAAYRKQQVEQTLTNPQVQQQWLNGLLENAKIVVNPTVRLVPGAKMPIAPTGKAAPAAPKPTPMKKISSK